MVRGHEFFERDHLQFVLMGEGSLSIDTLIKAKPWPKGQGFVSSLKPTINIVGFLRNSGAPGRN